MDRLMLLLCLVLSCQTPRQDPPAEASQSVSQRTLPADPEAPTNGDSEKLPEPTARQMERLHTWLAAQETGFDLERLEDCEAQLLTRADNAQSRRDIQRAAGELQADVAASLPLYHWCYFHMMSRLEYQLEQQNLGRSYQDKMEQFLRESKALFIVAESLDRTRRTRSYRRNLQTKYIALSQAFFGRQLTPVEADSPRPAPKPAARFQDE